MFSILFNYVQNFNEKNLCQELFQIIFLLMHKRKKDSLPEVKFIVDDSHYFIPLTLVKAFSSTIRSKSQDDQFITYQFENLKDPQGLFNLIVNLFYCFHFGGFE